MTTLVLLKKELTEHVRTYKLLIVSVVLLAFGVATPLLLAYLPELLEVSGNELALQVPEFTAADALKSYLDTLGQVGVLTVILVSMGAIALERDRGTAVLVLSKPVGMGPFVLAKLLGLAVLLAAGLIAGALGFYWSEVSLLGAPEAVAFALANLLVGLYLLVVTSVTLLFSSVMKNQIAAGVLALGVVLAAALLAGIPVFEPYLPASLMHWAYALVAGENGSRWAALVAAAGVILGCAVGAWRALQRQEM